MGSIELGSSLGLLPTDNETIEKVGIGKFAATSGKKGDIKTDASCRK